MYNFIACKYATGYDNKRAQVAFVKLIGPLPIAAVKFRNDVYDERHSRYSSHRYSMLGRIINFHEGTVTTLLKNKNEVLIGTSHWPLTSKLKL